MSDYIKQKMDELVEKFGPVPDSWKFGDGLDYVDTITESATSASSDAVRCSRAHSATPRS